MFFRYDLRTTDPDAALRFYSDVVGLDFGADEAPSMAVWPLHERARARGAPAHWLGALAVDDIETVLRRLIEAGSERLGPSIVAKDGSEWAKRATHREARLRELEAHGARFFEIGADFFEGWVVATGFDYVG